MLPQNFDRMSHLREDNGQEFIFGFRHFLMSRCSPLCCGLVRILKAVFLVYAFSFPTYADSMPVTPHTINLTIKQLLEEMSEPSQQRSDAIDMFLLGIFDQTEGKLWCDYSQFKVDTLRNVVFGQLSELRGEALSHRAAPAVSDVLAKNFPCKD